MKLLIFLSTKLLVSLFLCTSGYFIKIPTNRNVQIVPDRSLWVRNQRKILEIFKNVCDERSKLNEEDDVSPEILTDMNAVKDSVLFLSKNEIYSELNDTHLNELRSVYKILVNAKDFNEFYAVAAWLKDNVNCVLFINAFYAALLHRNAMERMMIPPPYEILPNYFIKKDTIIKGILILNRYNYSITNDDLQFDGNVYTLDTNYTAELYENDQESKLAYFLEDVGFNSYYFMKHLEYAPWTYVTNQTSANGMEVYQMLKHLLARYDLERYANGLPEMKSINWDSIEAVDYDPMLMYSNGEDFLPRSTVPSDENDEYRAYLKNIEDNIGNLVLHLRQSGYTKSDIMDHLMDILFMGEKSYEKVAIRILKTKDNRSPPSALEHYMTKLRDPVYWQIMRKVIEITDAGLAVFEQYTRDELYCPGVVISNVELKKLITYFDFASMDVTDALKSNRTQSEAKLIVRQPRLNHKEFSVKLNISSQIAQKVLIKMYLSPNYQLDEVPSNTKKNYMQLHSFVTILKAGNNILTVSSGQMNYLQDFMSINNVFMKVDDVEYGFDDINSINLNHYTEFPSHLILPKGSATGLNVKFLVFVAPFFKSKPGSISLNPNTAISSPGYPFDLMQNQNILNDLSNVKFKEIIITHKGENKVTDSSGLTKKWTKSESYDFSPRPMYDYASKKGTYDYSSKKEQYSKKYVGGEKSDSNPEAVDNPNTLEVKPLQVTKVDDEVNSNSNPETVDNENTLEVKPLQDIKTDDEVNSESGKIKDNGSRTEITSSSALN